MFYVASCQSTDQFHEAGIVRITNGGLAIWLHPFGMLEPQVVVNLLPKFAIGVDLVRHILFWPYFSSWEVISGL